MNITLKVLFGVFLIIFSTISPSLTYADEQPVSLPSPEATTQSTNPIDTSKVLDSDEDDDSLDLGDDQAEADAVKDFTGVVRQSKPYTCGPAALATLLTQLGNDTSEQAVLEHIMGLNEEKGVSLLALKVATQQLGSQVALKRWSADQILSYIKDTQDPVLIHDEKKGVGGHFSVIREYDATKGLVELSDTEAGNIKYSVTDFAHLYTGNALVVYEGAATGLLADPTTDISDDAAAAIWGKYVPVNVLAANNGNSAVKAAATAFADCTKKALALGSAAQRTAQRTVCYDTLAKAIGTNLNSSGELGFAASYTAGALPGNLFSLNQEKKDEAGQLGTNTIVGMLQSKLKDSKSKLTNLQSQVDQKRNAIKTSNAVAYDKKMSLQSQINAKSTAVTNTTSQKIVLESALGPKRSSADTLNREISSGSFTQNGQSFALGAVGNQVSAQSATYSRLSSSLNARLSSLDGQISQAQRSRSSAESNRNNANRSATVNDVRAGAAWASYSVFSRLGSRFRSTANNYLNEHNRYKSWANNDRNSANYWQGQVNNYSNQINNLNNQKNSARQEVNAASAEVARLQRLKSFGEQEVQRKKNVLNTLQNEIRSLQSQLDRVNGTLNQFKKDLSSLQSQYTAVANIQPPLSQSQINQLNNDINNLTSQINVLNAEISAQQAEISNEASFERSMSDKTNSAGTEQMRSAMWGALKTAGKDLAIVAGVGVAVVGGAAICVGTVVGCGPVVATAGSVLASPTVLVITGTAIGVGAANDAKVVVTQKDLLGNEYTDAQWEKAMSGLMTDTALVAGAGAAKYAPVTIEKLRASLAATKIVFKSPASATLVTNDVKLTNIIRDLYKGESNLNRIGSGSTADAIRNELVTGLPTEGKFHSDKGRQYISALENWLKANPNAPAKDKEIAQLLKQDLIDALEGR